MIFQKDTVFSHNTIDDVMIMQIHAKKHFP